MNTASFREALLLIGFRHSVSEPNVEAGLARVASIFGRQIDPADFHDSLASSLRDGLIREPVRLPEGSLQCHWRLELTPNGVAAVRTILDQHGQTADQLLESLRE